MDDYEVERQGIFAAARQEAIEFKREFAPEFRFPARMSHGNALGQAAHTASGRTTSGLHQSFDWPETKADADIACVTMTLAFPWRPQAPKNEPPHPAADYELRFEPIKNFDEVHAELICQECPSSFKLQLISITFGYHAIVRTFSIRDLIVLPGILILTECKYVANTLWDWNQRDFPHGVESNFEIFEKAIQPYVQRHTMRPGPSRSCPLNLPSSYSKPLSMDILKLHYMAIEAWKHARQSGYSQKNN